ncbi:hypothetical protein [Agromyces allii]|nr:hypothetical protein [Agromyces allii]
MNTAVVSTGQAPVRTIAPQTFARRMSRRAGLALLAWAEKTRRRAIPSREELAELHERREVAERLREERFGSVAVGRLI